MHTALKTGLWQQFGAAIDYLEDVISDCPDSLWQTPLWLTPDDGTPPQLAQFWYVAYHTLFWLDIYLTGSENNPVPDHVYTKAELLTHLRDSRQKCRTTIENMTEEQAAYQLELEWGTCSFFELLLYNMRHVHGHASQLQMLLGQHIGPQPDFVTQVREDDGAA